MSAAGLAVTLALAIATPAAAQNRPFDPRDYQSQQVGEATQVLVIGTPHLSGAPDSFDPAVLEPLLARLAAFHPDAIALEAPFVFDAAHHFDASAAGSTDEALRALGHGWLVGIVAQPHHMAVAGSGKTEMNCRVGWCYGNFIKRLCTIGWALTGLIAAVLFANGAITKRELVFGAMIKELLPSGLIGLMIAAIGSTFLTSAACEAGTVTSATTNPSKARKDFFNIV